MAESSLDSKARRAAERVGLRVRKSRHPIHANNLGGYMILEPIHSLCFAGEDFDMTAEDVIAWCAEEAARQQTGKDDGNT